MSKDQINNVFEIMDPKDKKIIDELNKVSENWFYLSEKLSTSTIEAMFVSKFVEQLKEDILNILHSNKLDPNFVATVKKAMNDYIGYVPSSKEKVY
jgi:hypothetical protein